MPSVTPTAPGVVNLAGPLTRHQTGQILTYTDVAGTSAATTPVDWTAFTGNAAGTRVTVDLSLTACAAVQIWNLSSSATIFISLDLEDASAGEATPIPALNGFQIDHPSASLSIDVWSVAGGEAFVVRAFAQTAVVP
jgi:hypothetical protein